MMHYGGVVIEKLVNDLFVQVTAVKIIARDERSCRLFRDSATKEDATQNDLLTLFQLFLRPRLR